jgi:hypothetical protein
VNWWRGLTPRTREYVGYVVCFAVLVWVLGSCVTESLPWDERGY